VEEKSDDKAWDELDSFLEDKEKEHRDNSGNEILNMSLKFYLIVIGLIFVVLVVAGGFFEALMCVVWISVPIIFLLLILFQFRIFGSSQIPGVPIYQEYKYRKIEDEILTKFDNKDDKLPSEYDNQKISDIEKTRIRRRWMLTGNLLNLFLITPVVVFFLFSVWGGLPDELGILLAFLSFLVVVYAIWKYHLNTHY